MQINLEGKVVLISGASSGIGRAMALAFAREGTKVALGARRLDRLAELQREIFLTTRVSPFINVLDVRDSHSVDQFVHQTIQHHGRLDILINNAGLALGKEHLIETQEEDWQAVLDTNIMGVLRLTKAVLPTMLKQSEGGHVINLGSIAGHISYEGGAVYCASKHALRAVTQALRQELLGKPIRLSSIDPGMVETEFSKVRFRGDEQKAAAVYAGFRPLRPEDIAECAVFLSSRPPHVNIDEVIVTPVAQAGTRVVR